MNQVIRELLAYRQRLETILAKAETDLKKMPQGRLRISPMHGSVKCYQIYKLSDGTVMRKYLNRGNEKIRNGLAQKEYLEKLIVSVKDEIREINKILERNKLMQSIAVYDNFPPCKKKFVSPLMLNDEDFAMWWKNVPFEPFDKWPEELKYPTKHGEMVRTKSEAIIADAYFDLGIPYRYECPVKLFGGEVRHPDFTVLDASKRKVIYHEHLGMLDDSGYRRNTMQKLDLYRRSGIYVGKNLILTHETAASPLNIRVFKQNLIEMFELDKNR